MLTSVKSSLMSAFVSKSQGFVGISGFENPVSCIQEHAGCAHSLEHIVLDDHNEGVGGDIGHRWQGTLITVIPF
jgi:hypothetical protein